MPRLDQTTLPNAGGIVDKKVKTITVFYSCKGCGSIDVPVEVPARESPDRDIVEYINNVRVRVSHHHFTKHLLCEAKSFELKIPDDGDDNGWIGRAKDE
jgi:hypothetical protein